MTGAIYIPDYVAAPINEVVWLHAFRASDDPATGYYAYLAKVGNVRAIDHVVEGPARPAWYPAHAPNSQGENLAAPIENTAYNVKYYFVTDGTTTWLQWTVPAAGVGCDKLVVTTVNVSGGGTLQIKVNGTVVGTVDTNGPTNFRNASTITLATPLALGDAVRLDSVHYPGKACRVCGFYAYDSDGKAVRGEPFALPASAAVTNPGGSSFEFAYALAPAGQVTKFVGGVSHQVAPYACEVTPTDTWTKDGVGWTPVVGWTVGEMSLHRTSVVDYLDAGHTLIADLDYTYTFGSDYIQVQHSCTARIALNVWRCYVAMFAAMTSFTSAVSTAGEGVALDVTDDDRVPPSWCIPAAAASGISMLSTPHGALARMQILASSPAVSDVRIWRNIEYDKLYFRCFPATASGSTWGATWKLSFGSTRLGMPSVIPLTNATISGVHGGPFTPSSVSYTLTNNSGTSVDWMVANTQAWVTLDNVGGALAAGDSTTITVSISNVAASLPPGNYSDTITFTSRTDGENYTTRSVSLTIPTPVGDISGDGYVDVIDLLYLVEAFGAVSGDANYSAACDFNIDGSVDVIDLLTLVENFGT